MSGCSEGASERAQTPAQHVDSLPQVVDLALLSDPHLDGDDELGVDFEQGAPRVAEELVELATFVAAPAFGNVGGNGDGRAADL